MVNSNDLIIERLQDIHNRAINASNRRDFFFPLFEYIAVYDEEPILEDGSLYTSHGPIKGRYGYLSYILMTLAEDENY